MARYAAAALALVLAAAQAAWAGKVSMCVDDGCAKKVKREKLDCTIHKNKKRSLTVGFKLSVAFAAKVGPEIGFGRSTEINWGKLSQELIRRYEELCDMHNKGHLSVSEFDRRYAKLEEHYGKAKDLKEEIEETVEGRSAKAFKDLEEEERRHAGLGADPGAVKERIGRISTQIDALYGQVADKPAPAPEEEGGEEAAPDFPSKRQGR